MGLLSDISTVYCVSVEVAGSVLNFHAKAPLPFKIVYAETHFVAKGEDGL